MALGSRHLELLVLFSLVVFVVEMSWQREMQVSFFCFCGALVPAVAVPADLVLAAFEEGAADWRSTF
jgi:hypothetical protein